MNNRFKFRIWNKELQKFSYYHNGNELFLDSFGALVYHDIKNNDICEVDDELFIIQQFTGMRDKNGKEIYEGDILKKTSFDGAEEIAEVKFCRCGFYFWNNYGEYLGDFNFEETRFEVIGNIFQNKSLLSV